jgi:hypothetical protein
VSKGPDKGDALIRYDLDSRETSTVVDADELIGWFEVNDDWVVWSEDTTLSALSLESGEHRTLSTSRDLYAPALNGDLAAWDDLGEKRRHRIVIADLDSGETTVVADVSLADLYNNFPRWDEDRLVWTDVVGEKGYYRIYDSDTGVITDYELADTDFRYPGYAVPSGERIYSINFDRVGEWDWTIQRLGYYSTTERRFVSIVPAGFIANYFRVWGDYVAVVDHESQFTLRPIDPEDGRDGASAESPRLAYRPIEGPVDFIEVSADGELIATRESAQSGTCTLYLVEQAK